jgi:hypothetical protein
MSEDNGPSEDAGREMSDAAWSSMSYILSGLLVWGGVGWLAARWTGYVYLFPIGVIVGVCAALYLIVIRFTK